MSEQAKWAIHGETHLSSMSETPLVKPQSFVELYRSLTLHSSRFPQAGPPAKIKSVCDPRNGANEQGLNRVVHTEGRNPCSVARMYLTMRDTMACLAILEAKTGTTHFLGTVLLGCVPIEVESLCHE
jgi:hypothetical protein